MALTKIEEELIAELKSRNFDKDDKVGIAIMSRDYKITDKVLNWLRENKKANSVEVYEFIDELIY